MNGTPTHGGMTSVVLAPYTTFRIGGPADVFYTVTKEDDLQNIVAVHEGVPVTVLGGGSNVLVSDSGVRGVVVHMRLSGILYEDQGDTITVVAGAGESWDALVEDTIARSAFGLENLSGIPGTVGASPIQNIGAYGSEAKDTVAWIEAFDTETFALVRLPASACAFGYRDSMFKKPQGKRYIVTRVAFTLSKTFRPNVAYKDLELFFGGTPPASAQDVRNAVLSVRAQKMPDLSVYGTAGSFFKNPVIPEDQFLLLQEKYPALRGFPDTAGLVKVPIAWVLDNVLHLNGVREGNVLCFQSQPLVICAHEGATAHDVDTFAKKIEARVYDATGIILEREVQLLS